MRRRGRFIWVFQNRRNTSLLWCQGSCGRWPRGPPGGHWRARVRPWKQGVQHSWGHSPTMLAPHGPPDPGVPALRPSSIPDYCPHLTAPDSAHPDPSRRAPKSDPPPQQPDGENRPLKLHGRSSDPGCVTCPVCVTYPMCHTPHLCDIPCVCECDIPCVRDIRCVCECEQRARKGKPLSAHGAFPVTSLRERREETSG